MAGLKRGRRRGSSSPIRVANGWEMGEIEGDGVGTVAGQPPTRSDGRAALWAVWEGGGDGAGRRQGHLMGGKQRRTLSRRV